MVFKGDILSCLDYVFMCLFESYSCSQEPSRYGVVFSSVGRVGVLCAEALQWTLVQLLAWVPLLRVTPPLVHLVSCHPLQLYCHKGLNICFKNNPQDKEISQTPLYPIFICII